MNEWLDGKKKKAVPFRNDTNGAIKGNTNCVL